MKYLKYVILLMFLTLNVTTSYATTIAVLGTGMDPNNELVKAKLWTNIDEIPGNGIDDDNNGYIDDINGWNFVYDNSFLFMTSSCPCHEPAIMEDMLTTNEGYLNKQQDVDIMIIKTEDWAKDKPGEDYEDTIPGIFRGIEYAIKNGANIISISYQLFMDNPEEYEQLLLNNPDVLFIQSAGNNGKVFTSNQKGSTGKDIPNRIIVGAISTKGSMADYSNYGDLVDIYADGFYTYEDTQTHCKICFTGTSLAVPKVVSKVIQMMNENKALNVHNIKNQLNVDYSHVLYDGPVDRGEWYHKFTD